ncbi:MAG TPA: hypothetical protein VF916_13825 [Ktedonobacterales bacterium]
MEPDLPPVTCPRCGLVDQVQKVSALVTAGVSTGSGSGAGYMVGSFGSSGSIATAYGRMYQQDSHQSLLSERLSPPAEPRLVRAWPAGFTIALIGLFLGVFCSCGIAGLITSLTEEYAPLVCGVLVALPFVAVAGVLLRTGQQREKRSAEAWQEEHEQWEAAIGRWFELYYCWRDDVVFVPGSLSAIPADDMWNFLRNDQ